MIVHYLSALQEMSWFFSYFSVYIQTHNGTLKVLEKWENYVQDN